MCLKLARMLWSVALFVALLALDELELTTADLFRGWALRARSRWDSLRARWGLHARARALGVRLIRDRG